MSFRIERKNPLNFFSRFYVYNHVLSKLEQYFPFAESYKLMQIHPAAVAWSQVLPLPNQCEARFLVPVDPVPGSAIFPIHEFALDQSYREACFVRLSLKFKFNLSFWTLQFFRVCKLL